MFQLCCCFSFLLYAVRCTTESPFYLIGSGGIGRGAPRQRGGVRRRRGGVRCGLRRDVDTGRGEERRCRHQGQKNRLRRKEHCSRVLESSQSKSPTTPPRKSKISASQRNGKESVVSETDPIEEKVLFRCFSLCVKHKKAAATANEKKQQREVGGGDLSQINTCREIGIASCN